MEDGTRNDNVQILFSPGCEQPLRDNEGIAAQLMKILKIVCMHFELAFNTSLR